MDAQCSSFLTLKWVRDEFITNIYTEILPESSYPYTNSEQLSIYNVRKMAHLGHRHSVLSFLDKILSMVEVGCNVPKKYKDE